MPLTPDEARARVLAHLHGHPGPVVAVEDADGRGATLLERASGKLLPIRWADLAEALPRQSPLRPHPYLELLFHDGRQLALADVGFAFAPSTTNTGPLPELPPTLCFRDAAHLIAGAHALIEAGDRPQEALRAVLLGLALLDGARAVGLDVGPEEKQLDALLRRLEARGVGM